MNKYIKHFITITRHKYYVMKFCFKCGLYKRGLLHDLSKYITYLQVIKPINDILMNK